MRMPRTLAPNLPRRNLDLHFQPRPLKTPLPENLAHPRMQLETPHRPQMLPPDRHEPLPRTGVLAEMPGFEGVVAVEHGEGFGAEEAAGEG